MSAIGVDVGGTTTRVGIVGADGVTHHLSTTPTPHGPEALTAHLLAEIGAMVLRSGDAARAIGVGLPGRIDAGAGTVAMAVNLGVVEPLPLGGLLADAFALPVALGNDVDLAALGASEHLGPSVANLAYLSIGTGFAAGLVLDGSLHRGAIGAGEIGHLPVPGGNLRCSCGQVGCAETMASGASMLQQWGHGDGDIAALWDAADAGDAVASSIRSRFVDTIAWVTQCTMMMLDVETIAIGGGVSKLGARLLQPLRAELDARAVESALLATYRCADRVVVAPAGVEYGVTGAAIVARALVAGESIARIAP